MWRLWGVSRKPYLSFIYVCVLLFSLGCSRGVGVSTRSRAFSLSLRRVWEMCWCAALECRRSVRVCARGLHERLESATGDQFVQRLVYWLELLRVAVVGDQGRERADWSGWRGAYRFNCLQAEVRACHQAGKLFTWAVSRRTCRPQAGEELGMHRWQEGEGMWKIGRAPDQVEKHLSHPIRSLRNSDWSFFRCQPWELWRTSATLRTIVACSLNCFLAKLGVWCQYSPSRRKPVSCQDLSL